MRRLLAYWLLLLPWPALAQAPVVVSAKPDSVAVTFYRDTGRGSNPIEFDPESDDVLGGFVLVDEVREVELPPGEVVVRFEGVASGIVPQSAILTNADLSEKNFDSRLLSQRGLIDAYTGQRVTVRRTDPKTGKAVLESGTIVSRPDALLLHTARGYEAIQCDGTLATLLYPGKPLDLTAKPTLSLTTRSDQKGGRVKLRLAYLAGNFDWQANYVGTFARDAQALKLTGWMTLASRDRTSFVDAETSAVAGVVARDRPSWEEEEVADKERRDDPYAPDNIEISAGCWPMGRTSGSGGRGQLFGPGRLPTIEAPIALRLNYDGYGGGGGEDGEIVVTATRVADPVDLGDVKLYTVLRPTTVAARSMKQVRFLQEKTIRGETLYLTRYDGDYIDDAKLIFRFRNRKEDGIGVPLPLGQVALFQETRLGRQLVGETSIRDKAVEEDVEIDLSEDDDGNVSVDDEDLDEEGDDWVDQKITVTNDNGFPILAEVEFRDNDEYRFSRFSKRTFRRDGNMVWRVEVPAEGERSIGLRRTEVPEPEG